MAYVYLIGTAIYAVIWVCFYIARKDLRRKLFFTSLFAAPLGFAEIFFIPEYWTPKFQTITLIEGNLFLESILFSFFLGGVVSTIYQITFKEKLFKTNKINPWVTLIGPALFLTYFLDIFSINFMHYVFLSLFVGSFIVIYFLGKDSRKIIYSSLLSLILYSILYFVLWYSYPEISASYQPQNLFGVYFFGIPIEEFLWVFSFSLYWAPMYEIWRDYKKSRV